MSTQILDHHSQPLCFEQLPDEILLSVCRYLSPVDVLDSVLNLNARLNRTIASYREKIFFHHLSYRDFSHLLNDHLPLLAPNVNCLYINARSMLNSGRLFEQKFPKMDQQFPVLRQLTFRHIDIETLENVSWRFNTMACLQELSIDMADDRLSSMPGQFDEFLCGKLFCDSNSFQTLKLHLNNYKFNLQYIRRKCFNLRQLTISVRHYEDLLILFEHCPNLEQLYITVGCSSASHHGHDTYPYEQLWWKVPYLTHFSLTVEEKEVTAHAHVVPSDIILKTIQNLYPLIYVKFQMNIQFALSLPITTSKDDYINKYVPYANGLLWQQALQRHDNHSITFELQIELDGLSTFHAQHPSASDMLFIHNKNDVNFYALLAPTFSTAFWLQKNTEIQCMTTASKHVSIYTLPLTNPSLSTMVDTIDRAISVNSFPSHLQNTVQMLTIRCDPGYQSPTLSLQRLFVKLPHLIRLHSDKEFHLPPSNIICSNRLQSLSLQKHSLSSCCSLLNHLPSVMSLSLSNVSCTISDATDRSSKPILSITRLKLSLTTEVIISLPDISEYFPNVEEFYLAVQTAPSVRYEDLIQYTKINLLLPKLTRLRYVEISLPTKRDSSVASGWLDSMASGQAIYYKTTDSNSIIFKRWLYG